MSNKHTPFAKALELHQSGMVEEAIPIYMGIVRKDKNNPHLLFLLGTALFQIGKPKEGISYLKKSAEISPNPITFNNIGTILAKTNKSQEAIENFNRAIALAPSYAEAYSNRGAALRNLARLDESLASCSYAIQLDPNNIDAYINQGNARFDLKKFEESLVSFEKAIELFPNYADAHRFRGDVLGKLCRYQEALSSYDMAIAIKPDCVEAYNNRGALFRELKMLDEALVSCARAIALKPDYVDAYLNRGITWHEKRNLGEALVDLGKAIELNPNCVEAYLHQGAVYLDLKMLDKALANCERVTELKPDNAEGYNNRGAIFQELKKFDLALASYEKAIALNPEYAEAYLNHASVLYQMGLHVEANVSATRALRIKQDFVEAIWLQSISVLPVIQTKNVDTYSCRTSFSQKLAEMGDWFLQKGGDDGYKGVGSAQPFYIAYQEENNKPILSEYGALCSKLMLHWQEKFMPCAITTQFNKPIRIGVVSAHIRHHSVWDALTRGWIEHLDRDRFELHFFHTGNTSDHETVFAKSIAANFVEHGKDLVPWVEAIVAAKIDILLYPEIGMDPITTQLASLRLAPVQVGSWGHPETSGLPTLDYFLSATLLEPENSQEYYSERLVKLPNLGVCCKQSSVALEPVNLEHLGISTGQPLLICAGAPFKYQPKFDHVFIDIARRLDKCQFIFFIHENVRLTDLFKSRIYAAFLEAGLNADDYCCFIPWQPKSAFYGLMKCADVFLDTIGFSGFNTALQAIEAGLPIVTREGKFMRGRLASGILKRIGLEELIVQDEESYIELVEKLARNREYQQQIRIKMKERSGVVYDDLEPIKAIEEFFSNVCQSPVSKNC